MQSNRGQTALRPVFRLIRTVHELLKAHDFRSMRIGREYSQLWPTDETTFAVQATNPDDAH